MEILTLGLVLSSITLPVLLWQYWRWWNWRLLELAAKVPGPPAIPVLGNALLFMHNPNEQLKKFEELTHRYGQYVRVWIGPDLNIVVANPEDIRLLLTSNKMNMKGPVYEHMKPIIGPGILSGGKVWRNHRKIVTPSYNKKSVHHFARVFNMEAENLVQVLYNKDPKDTFNIYYDVLRSTTQSVCQTLMGLSKDDSLNIKNLEKVILSTPSMYSLVFKKMTRWWLQIPIIFWLSGTWTKLKYFIKISSEMSGDIVSKRRKALERNEGVEDAKGIVDRYMLSGELSEQEIRWETFSVFTTSQEASAKIASGVLLFLAHLPDWQEKVYNEILECLGPHDDFVTEDHLKNLKHLDMVYKEVLRYLPIAAVIQRTVEEEVTINKGSISLPAGTSVVIPIHILHRDPEYWEEPDKVKPERFSPENVKKRNPNSFVPFSLGPMDCIGRVYATALIKTMVVRVIRHLVLEADGVLEDLGLHIAISVRFTEGYNLRVRPRPRNNRAHVAA